VKNLPFIDGNKRTGILAAMVFLGINDTELTFNEATIVAIVYGLAASEGSESQLADWLRSAASPQLNFLPT
jgi:death on curing protein